MQPLDLRLRHQLDAITLDALEPLSPAELDSLRTQVLDYMTTVLNAAKHQGELTDGYVETIRLCTRAKNAVLLIDSVISSREATFSTKEGAKEALQNIVFFVNADANEALEELDAAEDVSEASALTTYYLTQLAGILGPQLVERGDIN